MEIRDRIKELEPDTDALDALVQGLGERADEPLNGLLEEMHGLLWPCYVDVAIARWEQYVGGRAEQAEQVGQVGQ